MSDKLNVNRNAKILEVLKETWLKHWNELFADDSQNKIYFFF